MGHLSAWLSKHRRWLAYASLAWAIVVYLVLRLSAGPDGVDMLSGLQTGCRQFDPEYPQAFAQCMSMASQAVAQRDTDAAQWAAVLAFMPIGILWALAASAFFLRGCALSPQDSASHPVETRQ